MHVKSDTEYIAKTGHTIDIEGNIPLELKQELVRCKDCKKRYTADCTLYVGDSRGEYGNRICRHFSRATMRDDFFCPDGERKTDDRT